LDVNKRFSEEQIIGFLREADKGVPVKELCRKHGFSEGSYYLWRSKFGGMDVSDAKRLKALETENARLKKLLAVVDARKRGDPRGASKKMVTAPVRRELVRRMQTKGLTERRGLAVVGMSASSLRYEPRPDRKRGTAGAHRGAGAATSALRRRHDPPEAAPGRRARELQARRAAVPA
jgi:hypothetical protein